MTDAIVKEWFEANYGYMGRTWADLPDESKCTMRGLWKHAKWLSNWRAKRYAEPVTILWYPGLILKEFMGWCDG